MQWGVRAYKEWRDQKLTDYIGFDVKILEVDISTPTLLTKENLIHALCIFISEVTKINGEDYQGKTLYEMITSTQKYLHESHVYWKILEDPEFLEVRNVLDNVMKERAAANLGTVVKQAQCIPLEFENQMWESGVLGEDTPDKLRNTVLFLLGMNCGLRAGDERYDLRRDTVRKQSQLTFERSENSKWCLVYREDSVTKTNDGGLESLKKQRKVVWVFPNEDNINRCTVRLVDKYISLLSPGGPKTKKYNFYLRSLEKPNPAQMVQGTICRKTYSY